MSVTVIIWLALFACLTLAAFVRPVYAVALYMLTFFLAPPFWWWGSPIAGYRWNFIGGVVLVMATLMAFQFSFSQLNSKIQFVLKLALAMLVNATFVHLVIAGGSEISGESYTLLAKLLLLFFLFFAAIKTKADFKIAMIAILLGAAYIGYEVTFNDRGSIEANRLEGIGAPGASSANHFASLMVTVMPLVAPFFLAGKKRGKILAVVCAPLILNVVLLCNSRGAFLAAIVSAFVFLASAPKSIRGKAWKLIAFGLVATFMLMGDARILERFATTFVAQEERDSSAQSRIEYAKAGLAMAADYPLGAGGDSFKKVHGVTYLRKMGIANEAHAIHNGFINEACEWGVLGVLLRIGIFAVTMLTAWKHLRIPEPVYLDKDELIELNFDKLAGCAFLAGCSAFLVTSLFGDHFDSEWGLWLVALMLSYVSLNPINSEFELEEDEDAESVGPNEVGDINAAV